MGCPSDSPDDYTALNELKAKPAFRQKFQVQDAWVDFDVSEQSLRNADVPHKVPLLRPTHNPALPCPALPYPALPCPADTACCAPHMHD